MTESRTVPTTPDVPPNIDHANGQSTPMPLGTDPEPLRAWLDTYIEHHGTAVRLPRNGREYHVHLPTERAREQLFEASRKNPMARPPFWSTIWASGIGLADFALEHRAELEGQTVLELGCGMGVTASAVLEAGAELVAVDLSDLALGLCRYNTLTNTGRAPRSLKLNWREEDAQALLESIPDEGFPFILAADVLYESPDIQPLIDIIERLLAPDGILWLAEPDRRVAQRFLDTLALAGWQGRSIQERGPWHDGRDNPVNIHLLRRPSGLDPLRSTLGGWRS